MRLDDDVSYQRFLRALNFEKSTLESYTVMFEKYVECTGKSLSEHIREAEEDEENRLRMYDRRIFKYLHKFRDCLMSENMRPSSVNKYISTIKRFYHFYGIETPPVRVKEPPSNRIFDKLPSQRDIRLAINYAKPVYKAMMLLQVSSGMGASEVCNLRLEDFEKAIGYKIRGDNIDELIDNILIAGDVGTWHIRRKKTRYEYVTFSTLEANLAILEYLKDDGRIGGMLFKGLKSDRMLVSSYLRYLRDLNDRLGLGWSKSTRRLISSHNLRRFFATQLYSRGMDKMTIDWLLGHKVSEVDSAYFKFDVESAREEYRKYMDALLIEKRSVRVEVDKERVKRLVYELKEKEKRIEELEGEMRYVMGLIEDLKPLKRVLRGE